MLREPIYPESLGVCGIKFFVPSRTQPCSLSGLATLFGGTNPLGRHVVNLNTSGLVARGLQNLMEKEEGGWPLQASAQALHTAAFYSRLNLQLAMHQRMCSTSFRVFLCGYGMKVLAQDFYLNPSSVCFFPGTGRAA